MAKKNVDAQAKAKRQKKIAIVGGILFVALLAFQVPRTLKMLHPKNVLPPPSAAKPATTTSATGTTGAALAPPTLDGSGGAAGGGSSAGAGSATGDGLVDPSAATASRAGQLVNFDRFRSKDPFAQQVQDCSNGCSSAASGSPSGNSGSASPSSPAGASSPNAGATPTAPAGAASATPKPAASAAQPVTTAAISVNGVRESVAVGKDFPAASPTFVLLSLTRTVARIGIAGGSYESGTAAVKLRLGQTLTLQNTADGSRYVVRLLAIS